ncbi:hypothetical protein MWU75_07060 [Ornithinimicrobium sp. F0845]|uniref:hypothetical protein n=1 Tax=Ornithinimicrobium sp. F0845 TaxID=2926412 RepID=UPI001FF6EB70|nr:hypothetical protein [Ornithinimicrobium sp. F0845]MCK0111893.1 hypothetical protein [Ornithinimicrobium sp. F0845]
MTEPSTAQTRVRGRRPTTGTAVITVLAIPVGLGLSIFGFFGWCVGPLILIAGLVGQRLRRGWASWAIWIGVGLTLGALAYITIGLLTPDGPSSGGESGSPLN